MNSRGRNLYVAGHTYGSFAGANQGYTDAFLVKYDGSGTHLWTRQLGTTNYDRAYGVCPDRSSSVYICGVTKGAFDGQNRGDYDAFVSRYDSSGNLLWSRQIGTSDTDYAYGVATDAHGGVYVTGCTAGALGLVSQ